MAIQASSRGICLSRVNQASKVGSRGWSEACNSDCYRSRISPVHVNRASISGLYCFSEWCAEFATVGIPLIRHARIISHPISYG